MDEKESTTIAVRTPEIIAGEILAIQEQNKKILLVGAIEIGKRLTEAKTIIPYGEFVDWLAQSVNYSERTAYNMMRLYQEYGLTLASSAEDSTGTAPFAALSCSQALALLGIPAEERVEFIAELDLDNTGVRELKQAIAGRNQARAENTDLRKQLNSCQNTVTTLHDQLQKANADMERRTKAHWRDLGDVNKLKLEIKNLKDETKSGRRVAELEQQLDDAVLNLKKAKADAQLTLITKGFDELIGVIDEMVPADQETFALYILQVNRFIWKMSQRLRQLETVASLKTLEASKAAAAARAAEILAAEEAAEAATEMQEVTAKTYHEPDLL